ncbi:MAG: sirohydrochlorin chelatase, partial [Rubrivivax sp.]
LPEAAAALHAQGCRRLCVLPMFLGVGGHVRKDLPALLEAIAHAHPDLAVRLSPAIGEQDDVVQAMASAALRQADGSLA